MASELTNIYALIKLEELRKAGLLLANFYPVIHVKPFDLSGLKDVLKYAFMEGQERTFSIYLKIDSPADEKDSERWFNDLAILLAHPGYSKIGNDKIIVFSSANNIAFENEHFRSTLFSTVRKHGFRYMRAVDLFDSQRFSVKPDGLFFVSKDMMRDRSAVLQLYQESFLNSAIPPSLFIEYNPDSIQWVVDLGKEAKQTMLQSNATLFKMAAERHLMTLQFYRVLHEKELIKEDLVSTNIYLDFLLTKSREMNESDEFEFSNLVKLKKFYYNEYEILPLWYKRLGHVIKVIMGKRTLKSLFKDDTPKYKQ